MVIRQQPYVDQSLITTQTNFKTMEIGAHGTYGNVWVPNVSLGWRPYYDGRWTYSPGGMSGFI